MARKKKTVVDGENTKKPFYKKWWFWVLVVLAIGAAGTGGDDTDTIADNTPKESAVAAESSSEAETESSQESIAEVYDTNFEKVAHEVFGENLREFEYIENECKILITTYVPGNLTENLMKRSFHNTVIEYAKSIKDENFVDFYIDGEASMTDEYGNTEDSKVFTIGLAKETVDKINFDNFQTDNLEGIADAVFVHPAFLN